MRRVDFASHPTEAVKVPEGWGGEWHCLICATPVAPPTPTGE
jgi:hypothetical protein